MKPTMACGHTEYDHGHCAQPGCANDYRLCEQCNPQAFREAIKRVRYADPFEAPDEAR